MLTLPKNLTRTLKWGFHFNWGFQSPALGPETLQLPPLRRHSLERKERSPEARNWGWIRTLKNYFLRVWAFYRMYKDSSSRLHSFRGCQGILNGNHSVEAEMMSLFFLNYKWLGWKCWSSFAWLPIKLDSFSFLRTYWFPTLRLKECQKWLWDKLGRPGVGDTWSRYNYSLRFP